MSNVGPVCHIPPTNTTGNPQAKSLPALPAPPTPGKNASAFDNEVAAFLNALYQLLNSLLGQGGGQGGTHAVGSSFVEVNRQVTTQRIFQNNDPNSPNWVDVKVINGLTLQDRRTGETWKWSR